MFKFDRTWTLQLQTNKEKFCDAFYEVVNKDNNKIILQNTGLGNLIGKDFFGTLRSETFTIWKRKGIFDLSSTGLNLDGKIIPEKNYLKLELRILNNFVFNYVKLFIIAIILTAITFFLVTRLISFIVPISDKLFATYSFITIPILFIIIFYSQLKIIDIYLDRLKNLYDRVLEKIEEQANSR